MTHQSAVVRLRIAEEPLSHCIEADNGNAPDRSFDGAAMEQALLEFLGGFMRPPADKDPRRSRRRRSVL
jgi:hypothetical protein